MIKKGFWNGEPCSFTVLVAKVADEPELEKKRAERLPTADIRCPWWVPFIGQQRQVIQVVYNGQTFYIDNKDGSGYRKVTEGKGSPQYGHRTVYVDSIISGVEDKDIIQFSRVLYKNVNHECDEGWNKIDPERYKKSKDRTARLLEAVEQSRKKLDI